MSKPSREKQDPRRSLARKDKLGRAANDVIDASVGAAAGAALGVLAGPPGMLVGAAAGALVAGVLGHQADVEREERDHHDNEVDDIDVEEEFFGQPRSLGVGDSAPPGSGTA